MKRPIREQRKEIAEASLQEAYALMVEYLLNSSSASRRHAHPLNAVSDDYFRRLVARDTNDAGDPRGIVPTNELQYARSANRGYGCRIGGRPIGHLKTFRYPPSYRKP